MYSFLSIESKDLSLIYKDSSPKREVQQRFKVCTILEKISQSWHEINQDNLQGAHTWVVKWELMESSGFSQL